MTEIYVLDLENSLITGPGWLNELVVGLPNNSYKPITKLLAHGRWFFPASSTTKTGRHDIAEILLKVVLIHQKSN